MATETASTLAAARDRTRTPPLENGDRLTRAEFERRYAAMVQVKKAELIEEIVYMPSPVRLRQHATPHAELVGWLFAYKAATLVVEIGDNATVRLDLDNEPQPDILMRLPPQAGGRSHLSDDDSVEGAPELVIEVASSTASYDLHEKKRVYRRNRVREYLVWLVDERRVEWWELREDDYVSLPAENGVIMSRVFPGLWLDTRALINAQSAQVLARLHQGLATQEHADFAASLASQMKPHPAA